MSEAKPSRNGIRGWIVCGFGVLEDLTYIGLGLLLAGMAISPPL